MNMIHPFITPMKRQKTGFFIGNICQPVVFIIRGIIYRSFPIIPTHISSFITYTASNQWRELATQRILSRLSAYQPLFSTGLSPSVIPPPGQNPSWEGGKNKNKHMQELGFKHPTKISLSAVIALTRGFLMLLQVS